MNDRLIEATMLLGQMANDLKGDVSLTYRPGASPLLYFTVTRGSTVIRTHFDPLEIIAAKTDLVEEVKRRAKPNGI